ncbi:MAG TPA: cell division regulator GpsB [Virgibacillus sp.]|nr:cell division regulator GpsB [Virgibacillus sp.]
MDTKRVQLTSKDILEKDFKTAMRGYNQEEVDEFLDMIIKDYNSFQKLIEELQSENERLKKNSNQMRTRAAVQPNHQVNYDILKRLSNLEKEVFGRKYADT